jgi:radical SAM superfamily enzyme YgiQ (UPF0313 family)
MERPTFRSPPKIVEDIRRLSNQGIRFAALYQDPRMGGEKYWKELMSLLRNEKIDIDRLSMDIFAPVNEEFIREVATIGKEVILYFCPGSGSCDVRKAQGLNYSNEDCLKTFQLCHKYHIPVLTFFSVGLAKETQETIKETWNLWNELCLLDQKAIANNSFGGIGRRDPLGGPIIGPIFIDPGSLAYDFPEKYGYRLLFKNLEEYIKALNEPSWHQWLNHETEQLDKEAFIDLIFESITYSIQQREKYGVYGKSQAEFEQFQVKANRIAVDEVNHIINMSDGTERELRFKFLRNAIDLYLISHCCKQDSTA